MLKSSTADSFNVDADDDDDDDVDDVADGDADDDDDDNGQERLVEVQQMLKSSPAVGFLTQISELTGQPEPSQRRPKPTSPGRSANPLFGQSLPPTFYNCCVETSYIKTEVASQSEVKYKC